jgi:uncharacterized protein
MHQISQIRKTALITGATSGIGEAYARGLAEKGYDLIITGRRQDIIEASARQIEEKYNVNVDVVIAELSEVKDINVLVQRIQNSDPIDVLVNNAGFTTKGYYYQEDIVMQEKMVLVHVIAMMKLVHAVLPRMIERKFGIIINVASIQAVTPMSLSTTYCSAKAFMKNFSISLHCEVKDHGIKVQCVFPGFTRTDLGRCIGVDMKEIKDRPMQHWMLPEEVVRISLADLNKKNKVICIPGLGNKAVYVMTKMMPEGLWNRIAPHIAKAMP